MATKFTLKRKPTEKERETRIVPGTTKTGGESPSEFAARQSAARQSTGRSARGSTKPSVTKVISTAVKGVAEKFNIQKQLEKSGSSIKVREMIYTGPTGGGAKSLIGKRIPAKTIAAAGKAAGLSKAGIEQVRHAIGVRRVSEVANTLINPKSQSLIKTALSKIFSKEGIILLGTLAGSVGLGKWAQKETPEPITFAITKIISEARNTGNYTLYWEAAAIRDELTDMTKWEQFLAWTPIISPFITIPKAIKGVAQGGIVMDELARQQEIRQETEESEDDMWIRIEEERQERREAERIEDEQYYAQIQKDIAKAKADAREEDERYWANILRGREEYEESKREAEEKYWEDVKKLNAEIRIEETKQYQEYAKSNLNFGLL